MPDGHAAAALPNPGDADLPVWDLADLYPGVDSPELAAALADSGAAAERFASSYAGRLSGMSGRALAAAIAEYERIDEALGRVMSYAQLLFSGDGTNAEIGQFYQSMTERATAISSHLIFFALELNQIDETALAAKLADPALAAWQPWLRDLLVFRPHQLSEELERLLHEKEVTGRSAWSRLFDETVAGMRVPLAGERLTVSDALNKLASPDRDLRHAAADAIGAAFSERIKLFGLVTNTLAKDKEIVDSWRRYPRPGSYRNRSNMVEDEVVDALVSAVSADYGRLSHRYYRLKAGWLGLDRLQHWDRNAPLPGADDTLVGWNDARRPVLDAYGRFSPEQGTVAARVLDNQWVDAALRPGKSGGAFAHPTVPAVHPYLLLNYHGKSRDVMTLAHELGHGVHQVLASRQGYLMAGTPLTLAETASVFGEMLTFQAMLDAEQDRDRRRLMLAGKVEDMLNTVVRQTAFYQFETLLHQQRRSGELTAEQIGDLWMQVQAESLGPAFEFSPEYRVYWSYVPHFVHSPFYVYAYAFGDCLVNALYDVYRSGQPGFVGKYLDMLRAGGTKRHRELLAPFGLDAADPGFWRRGLDVISGFIDQLEAA